MAKTLLRFGDSGLMVEHVSRHRSAQRMHTKVYFDMWRQAAKGMEVLVQALGKRSFSNDRFPAKDKDCFGRF